MLLMKCVSLIDIIQRHVREESSHARYASSRARWVLLTTICVWTSDNLIVAKVILITHIPLSIDIAALVDLLGIFVISLISVKFLAIVVDSHLLWLREDPLTTSWWSTARLCALIKHWGSSYEEGILCLASCLIISYARDCLGITIMISWTCTITRRNIITSRTTKVALYGTSDKQFTIDFQIELAKWFWRIDLLQDSNLLSLCLITTTAPDL